MVLFASSTTDNVTTPDGLRVVIRKLNHRSLDEAAELKQKKALMVFRDAGADLARVFREDAQAKAEPKDADAPEDRQAIYASYDKGIVLRRGIKEIDDEVITEKNCEDIDDLSSEDATFLHEKIIDLSRPPKSVPKGD
jgi:hypothetical protein